MKNPFWNRDERRLRALWRLIGQILALLLVSLVLNLLLGLGLMLISLLINALRGDTMALPLEQLAVFTNSPWMTPVNGLLTLAGIVFSVWLAGRFLDRRPMADFGFHFGRRWFTDLGFGLALGAVLMLFIFLVEWVMGWIVVDAFWYAPNPEQNSFALGISQAVIMFICVGIYEELFSRGYQLRNLAEGLRLGPVGPRAALLLGYVLSSSVFGVLHMGNPNASAISTLNLIVAGLFLGLGYLLTGELAISIGLHITWNFFQGNVFGFPVSGTEAGATFIHIQQGGPEVWTGGAFGPEAGLIGLAAIALGCALTVAWVRWQHGAATLQDRLACYPVRQAETPALAAQETPLPAADNSD